MSTPRRTWFKLPDSLATSELPDKVLATAVRLQAYMHQRWVHDDPDDPGTAVIGPTAAMFITGFGRTHVALQALSRLPLEAGWTSARARLETVQGVPSVIFSWPNLPDFQGWRSRSQGKSRPKNALSDADADADADAEKTPHTPRKRGAPCASRSPEVEAAWQASLAAFAAYGKQPTALTEARRKALRATVRDGLDPPACVHGYMAMHADRGGGDFDPLAHLTPETVFRASNRAKYAEAYAAAVAAGRSPPFKPSDGVRETPRGHEPRVSSERWA